MERAVRLGAGSTSNRTARASMCSITPGPTPTSARAGSIIRSCRCAVPFTPVPGRRLLSKPGPSAEHGRAALASAAVTLAQQIDSSSLHITFASEAEWQRLGAHGLPAAHRPAVPLAEPRATARSTISSRHFASRKRKAIRKERAEALASGLDIEHI